MAIVSIKDEKFMKKYDKPIQYYMDDRLKEKTDQKVIPALMQRDKDWIEVIDGTEGAGKSWFAFQRAKYIDPTFNLSRVVFTPEEFKNAIFSAKKGQAIVYDEAFTGLSSRASLSPINRYLVSLMMQMRQKNLFVILVLPTFFLLDKYAALFRTRLLTHVYETKSGLRGYFRVYNAQKKKLLFLYGKQTYSYSKNVFTNFKGRFYGVFALGDAEEEEKYRDKKTKALESTETVQMNPGQVKYMNQRNLIMYLYHRDTGFGYQKMSDKEKEVGMDMSLQQNREICLKFGEIDKEIAERDAKQALNSEK